MPNEPRSPVTMKSHIKNEHPISEYLAVKAHVESKGMIPLEKKRNKYGARGVRIDGFYFDSQKEGNFYLQLKMAQKAGRVTHFHRQVIFDLPGGTTYRCDFQVFYPSGSVRYIDVKGMRTKSFIRNKKQVEALYPVEIKEA